MDKLANWLISALSIFLLSQYLSGFKVDNFTTSLIVALVLGVINAFIKPIVLLLTLPINIITLGLFTFIINAGLLLVTDWLVSGFAIQGFEAAIIAAIALWLINLVINLVAFPVKPLAK